MVIMGKKYPENWQESPAAKGVKPGIGGEDTRLFTGGNASIGGINPHAPKSKKWGE